MTVNDLKILLDRYDGKTEVGLMESSWFETTFRPKLICVNRKNEKTKPGSEDSKQVLVLR